MPRRLKLSDLLAAIRQIAGRIAALEAADKARAEGFGQLSDAVGKLWRELEALRRRGGLRVAAPQPEGVVAQLVDVTARLVAVEEQLAGRPEAPRRVSAVVAARRLGVAPVTIRRLVEAGTLTGLALQLPDRERRVWVVDLVSLERLEADAVGATGAPKRAATGRAAPSPRAPRSGGGPRALSPIRSAWSTMAASSKDSRCGRARSTNIRCMTRSRWACR